MNKVLRYIAIAWLVLASTSYAFAERFIASIDRNQISLDETFVLTLTYEGSLASGQSPDVNKLSSAGLRVISQMLSQSYQSINGQQQQSHSWRYTLQPMKKGTVTIPTFVLAKMRTEPFEVDVIDLSAASGATQQPASARHNSQTNAVLGAPVILHAQVETKPIYQGQQGIYRLTLLSRTPIESGSLAPPDWSCGDPMVQAGKDISGSRQVKGVTYQSLTRRFSFRPEKPGTCTLPAPIFLGNVVDTLQASNNPFSMLGMPMTRPIKKVGAALKLKVLSAPKDIKFWLPAKSVKVWRDVDHKVVEQGKPVTVTYHMVVVGQDRSQLPEFKLEAIPGVNLYPEREQVATQFKMSQKITEVTQRFVIIPLKDEAIKLPGFKLAWWDVTHKKKRSAYIKPSVIKVKGVPALVPQKTMPTIKVGSPKLSKPVVQIMPNSSRWRWFSFSLLGVWVLTVVGYWYCKREKEGVKVQKEMSPDSLPKLVAHLTKACSCHDAKQSAQLLVEIGRRLWPQEKINHINQVAKQFSDAALTQEIKDLSAYLYRLRDGGTFWEGKSLWLAFKKAYALFEQQKKTKGRENQTVLPSFYPDEMI
jgi:hypothetical protein